MVALKVCLCGVLSAIIDMYGSKITDWFLVCGSFSSDYACEMLDASLPLT